MRICPKCKLKLPLDVFYSKRGKKSQSSYCRWCTSQHTISRQRKFKRECIAYKGGKCQICGYNKCEASLTFHHRDPSQKDFSISRIKKTNFDKNRQFVTSELDKCDLLCANCHFEKHYAEISERWGM